LGPARRIMAPEGPGLEECPMKICPPLAALVLILFPGSPVFAAEEYHRESVIIDWEKDQFDMYRYIDSYLREYEYYFVGYTAKENPADSVWKTQIITIAYINPDYVAVHEVHNYFMISHYFSHEKIVHHVSQEDYSPSPYQKTGGDIQYIRRFNAIVDKIRLLLTGEEDGKYADEEKRRQDISYLEGSRKYIY
jgi:hypothetical protein